jgi:predicted secreted protein
MNPATILIVFTILWWLVFFMVLPVGVVRDENPQLGNAAGAPKNSNLAKKAIITTIIATTLTFTFFFLLQHGYLDFMSPRE